MDLVVPRACGSKTVLGVQTVFVEMLGLPYEFLFQK